MPTDTVLLNAEILQSPLKIPIELGKDVSTRRTRNMRRRSKEQEHEISFLSNSCLFLLIFSFKDNNTIYRLLMTLEIPHTLEFHTQ